MPFPTNDIELDETITRMEQIDAPVEHIKAMVAEYDTRKEATVSLEEPIEAQRKEAETFRPSDIFQKEPPAITEPTREKLGAGIEQLGEAFTDPGVPGASPAKAISGAAKIVTSPLAPVEEGIGKILGGGEKVLQTLTAPLQRFLEGQITKEDVRVEARKDLQESLDGFLNLVVEKFEQAPEAVKQSIAAAGDIAELIGLVEGAGVGAKVAREAIPAAKAVAGEAVEQIAKKGVVSKEIGKLQKIGKDIEPRTFVQKQADKSAANLNRILPNKSEEFKRMTGNIEHGEWLNRRGINKTVDKNIDTLGEKFLREKNTLDDAISKVAGSHNPPIFKKVLDEAVDLAKLEERAGDLNLLQGIGKKLEIQGGVSAEDILKVKRVYERTNKFTYSKASDNVSASKLVKATERDSKLRESLIDIAEDGGFPELRDLSKEVQQTRFLLDQIAITQARGASKPIFNISDRLLGGASIADPKLALGVVAGKALGSEQIKSLFQRAFTGTPKKPITINIPRIELKAKELLKKERKIRRGETKLAAQQKKLQEAEAIKAVELEREGVTLGEGFQIKKEKPLTRQQQTEAKAREQKILQEEQAIMADELQKKGVSMGEGFQLIKDQPLTRQEQMMIRVTANAEEADQMARFIIEQRSKGNAVGEGFIIKKVENTPILAPKATAEVKGTPVITPKK